jgi:uncharacterized protein
MGILSKSPPHVADEAPLLPERSLRTRLAAGIERWRSEWKTLLVILGVFLGIYYLPVGTPRFDAAIVEALELARWYAQEHVILCLLPAFFIAGAIAVFVSQGAVMKYLGGEAHKALAYGVASVSGTILAVCSCTVLPLFAGIYRMGAGLGPAISFLYSGPAINALAIILTASVLGPSLGIARAVGAVLFAVIIGLAMQFIFRHESGEQQRRKMVLPPSETARPLWQNALYFATLVGILVFANWGAPQTQTGFWWLLYANKWGITAIFAAGLAFILLAWFGVRWWKIASIAVVTAGAGLLFPGNPTVPFVVGLIGLTVLTSTSDDEMGDWFEQSWDFAKQILPLLLWGVLISGFLLGRPGAEGLIPSTWVSVAVGGNSVLANFLASIVGAFMYFATLTEIPILQGLLGNGMGQGPALALLLAGPALSLPNMLVIRSVIGTKKTVVYIVLVVAAATLSGMIYGALY